MDIYKKLGLKIKELRNKNGISQADLAKVLGFKSDVAVVLIEKGERRLTIKNLKQLSDYFKAPISDFFDESDVDRTEKELYSILRADKKLSEKDVKEITSFIGYVRNKKKP